ncbi:MAG TPA: sensor histidine kinase [Erythrobacter sp.]|nr:sensor histidine kinase [Erythrobacter sp.]
MIASLSKDERPSVPFRIVLYSVVGLWATYYALAYLRWEMLGMEFAGEMARLRAIVVIVGAAVTLVLWTLLRLFDARPLWMKVVAALVLALPASLLLAQVNNYVFADMNKFMERYYYEQYLEQEARSSRGSDGQDAGIADQPEGRVIGRGVEVFDRDELAEEEREERQDFRQIDIGTLSSIGPLVEVAFSRYFMMLAWCALYLALLTGEKARAAERREQEFKNAAKAAELRSLRYQVNPHFLFNTLNSLSALVLTGKTERAEQMIQTISRFYRHSLVDDPTSDVLLEQEFDLQKLYLNIEAVRFPERLRCVFELPDALADARVPGMILQPLVENSVKYAVSAVNRPVTITISAKEEFDRLVITVSDDGPGAPEQAAQGFGIGLANVRDRLEARFGQDVVLSSASVKGGYKSEMRIPLTRNG